MTTARHLYALSADPDAIEAPGPLRLAEELHRLAEGETTVLVQNEALAFALNVDVRTVQRWKRALRELVPPAIAVTDGNRYSLRISLDGVATLLAGPRAGAILPTITPHVMGDTPHDHPLTADSITPVIPLAPHTSSPRAGAPVQSTTTTTTTTTGRDSHPRSPLPTITPPQPRTAAMPMPVSTDDLTVNVLIRRAGIQDTPEVVEAMSLLPREMQVWVLDYTREHARRPNPAFVRKVAENVADELASEAYGSYDELRAAWLGRAIEEPADEACDERSPSEPAVARAAANDQTPRSAASTDSEGVTPSTVRGVTPRAGSNLIVAAVGRALVTLGGWLERWAR